jgi:hypothetical protein|tara:strand:+ start:2411 stop:2518 length:108 start_codon:yes stop_codon:yes gene_type:complete
MNYKKMVKATLSKPKKTKNFLKVKKKKVKKEKSNY